MSTDQTFITNENNQNLLNRFQDLIGDDTKFFDCLVGYFFTSGFHALCQPLEKTEKIRVLVGINADRRIYKMIKEAQDTSSQGLKFTHLEVKEKYGTALAEEFEHAEDSLSVEEGERKFREWLLSGKLEIKAYPTNNLHAKLYIMTYLEGGRDVGRVVTGSSNFTQAGLIDNLEFNVELKGRADYDYAKTKFEELWANAVDVKEKYLETIKTKTWLNDTISPYKLYLKFLYEYFKEKINLDQDELFKKYLPENFLDLEYQNEAVKDARSKLDEYGGVFLSDVVGLGKTYISAMLAQQLEGRHLVIAPPVLLHEDNPGSWKNVFNDFRVPAIFESIGKLDKIVKRGTDRYDNVFIDEAHRFRTETNITYEMLAQICSGKKVILVTATPLNNTPKDILSQVKLFQKAKKSTIPNLANLESFFSSLEKKLKGLDRQKDRDEYLRIVAENAREIRDKLLKYLMVRRTRTEIINYFGEDLKRQQLRFPDIADPEPVFYELNDKEDAVFNKTIELITRKFKYARYMPMLYYKGKIDQLEEQAQKNMGKFMKILLVKRLESSFYAFRNTLARFIKSYEQFLTEFENGNVYVSAKHSNKIFELLEAGDDEAIQRLIDEDKAQKFSAKEFKPELRVALNADLKVLKDVEDLWNEVTRDPKLLKFVEILNSQRTLKTNKLILFTESKETADYLKVNLDQVLPGRVIVFTGASHASIRDEVIQNFDAKVKNPKDDYRILIATEVLSEGVNLHRSNVVINYDIPWNPTRLMQRVGRVNRVDTAFDEIYTYNFFPTNQSNDQIGLKEAAEAKIQAFIETLGSDARLLTDGEEIKSHDLFVRLSSKKTITGEDENEESELKYLKFIRDIRDNNPDLFEQIKHLPKKARTGRAYSARNNAVLTYFRKSKLQKFFIADDYSSKELDFFDATKVLEARYETPRKNIGTDFYEYLERNKQEFEFATSEVVQESRSTAGRDSASKILRILKTKEIKNFKGFTDEDELYIKQVSILLEEGGLPKQTAKNLHKSLSLEKSPLKMLAHLRKIPQEYFADNHAERSAKNYGPREVILSEYLTSE